MAEISLEQQISEQVGQLDTENKQRVLDYVRALAADKSTAPRGTPGAEFVAAAAAANFDPDDLRQIAQAIEEGCEQVDLDGWQ